MAFLWLHDTAAMPGAVGDIALGPHAWRNRAQRSEVPLRATSQCPIASGTLPLDMPWDCIRKPA